MTRTVRVQLSCWVMVVVPGHLVTVRVLHIVRSLRGGGGGGGRETGGAVAAAVVVAVTVTVTVSSAGSTGLPSVRGNNAARGKTPRRCMLMASRYFRPKNSSAERND